MVLNENQNWNFHGNCKVTFLLNVAFSFSIENHQQTVTLTRSGQGHSLMMVLNANRNFHSKSNISLADN